MNMALHIREDELGDIYNMIMRSGTLKAEGLFDLQGSINIGIGGV
jgi:hypothetical protein